MRVMWTSQKSQGKKNQKGEASTVRRAEGAGGVGDMESWAGLWGNRVAESMTDIIHRKAAAQNSLNHSQPA